MLRWFYSGLWIGLLVGIIVLITYVFSGPVFFFTKTIIILTDRFFRREGIQTYIQFVVLPLIGAIVGALFGVAAQTLAENPPRLSEGRTALQTAAYVEFFAGFALVVFGPTILLTVIRKESNVVLSGRIWMLEQDYSEQRKQDLLVSIDRARSEEDREYMNGSIRFKILIPLATLLIVAYALAFWSDTSSVQHWIRVSIAIAGGLLALTSRIWVRGLGYKMSVKHLNQYQSEVNAMQPPAAQPSNADVITAVRDAFSELELQSPRIMMAASVALSMIALVATVSLFRRKRI